MNINETEIETEKEKRLRKEVAKDLILNNKLLIDVIKATYNNLLNFWNKSFVLNAEDKKELENINPDDYKSIAPNLKLVDALSLFSGCENVLDYGAGNGWASIIMAKCGAKHIKSVDVAPNFKNVVEVYSKSFNVYDKLDIHIE